MTYISKRFNDFIEADSFDKLLRKYGAEETKITAKWISREKEWKVVVSATINN